MSHGVPAPPPPPRTCRPQRGVGARLNTTLRTIVCEVTNYPSRLTGECPPRAWQPLRVSVKRKEGEGGSVDGDMTVKASVLRKVGSGGASTRGWLEAQTMCSESC